MVSNQHRVLVHTKISVCMLDRSQGGWYKVPSQRISEYAVGYSIKFREV